MASPADHGGAGDGGDGNVNIIPLLRTLAKGAAVTLGGVLSITAISSTTVALFTLHKKDQIVSPPPSSSSSSPSLSSSSSSSSMNKKNTRSCDVCKAKGFYMCKLCKGNATIEWSPLYDPVFINPCLCPTCDGHRIQRCLNCLGSGFIQ
ncbi:putative Heat shock protein DnaJ, cysteine-rich domain superfamily [Helianthus debilis subsp. tardiflorus]